MKNRDNPLAGNPKIGYCLGCGKQLTYSAVPVTWEVKCPSCRAVNVYVDSQQPTKLKQSVLERRYT